ncbi:MAG: hypothetical protein KIT11_00510 [Fimbriimonadaceae bacterium]|nr:hypothetical protein [Fimbriimonadaceae bacterium]QYK55145.1 MAG: hypothetical protein KF733_09025 [Fimbriimonadaceae bacterium]
MRHFFGFLFCLGCASSFAADARANGAQLIVNEQLVHTFATSFGGWNPPRRAQHAAEVVGGWQAGTEFGAKAAGPNWKVFLGNQTVVNVSPQEAAAFKTTPQDLAATLARRLNLAVGLPALQVGQESLTMTMGAPVRLRVVGHEARKAVLESSPTGVVRIERGTGELIVSPLAIGRTVLRIKGPTIQAEVAIAVLAPALNPQGGYMAEVFGRFATSEEVADAVRNALQNQPNVPGATTIEVNPGAPGGLALGESRTVTASVQATGQGYAPFIGPVSVRVANVGATPEREAELWYSNDPENVPLPSDLYWGQLVPDRSIRLLYHHKNVATRELTFRYLLANPSDRTARVVVTLGDSNPESDPTRAGYSAAEQFLTKLLRQAGEVVNVPPGAIVPMTVRRVAPGDTMSGLASLTLLDGGPERVVVVGDANWLEQQWDPWWAAHRSIGAWRYVRPRWLDRYNLPLEGVQRHVYPRPFRDVNFSYEVGGPVGYLRIGETPIASMNLEGKLEGNFGVVYTITGRLSNPTPEPVEVEVGYEASAGYSAGIFVMNDTLVKCGTMQPKQKAVVGHVRLSPGATKDVVLKTIPLSGANYPGTLTLQQVGIE